METILPASLKSYSPAAIADTCRDVRTVEQSLESGLPSIGRLACETSRSTVTTLIKLHLVALDAFLKQKTGLTPDEIDLIADEVMQTYSAHLTFADINLIFRNAKLGRYGEFYQNLTAAKVMRWFDEYVDRRMEAGYELSQRRDRERFSAPAGQRTALMQNIAECLGSDYIHSRVARHEEQKQIDENDFLRWRARYQATGEL